MGTYPTTIQSFGAITMTLPDRTHGPDIRLPIFKEGFGIMVKLAGITIGTLFSQCNGLTLQDEYKKIIEPALCTHHVFLYLHRFEFFLSYRPHPVPTLWDLVALQKR